MKKITPLILLLLLLDDARALTLTDKQIKLIDDFVIAVDYAESLGKECLKRLKYKKDTSICIAYDQQFGMVNYAATKINAINRKARHYAIARDEIWHVGFRRFDYLKNLDLRINKNRVR